MRAHQPIHFDLLVTDEAPVLISGFVAAFIATLFTVRVLVAYVSRHDFRPFA